MNILQLLHWQPKGIVENLDRIKWTGWTTIQLPPMQPTKQELNNVDDWWLKYQPTDLVIANMEEYKWLCREIHEAGLTVSVDLVVRHLAGQDYNPLYPSHKDNTFYTNKREYWLDPINMGSDDRWQVTHRCTGMPALNYFHSDIEDKIVNLFMDALAYCDYIRLDQAKHFALPSEGCNFYNRLVKEFGRERIYGECIQMPDSRLQNDYAQYIMPLVHWWECNVDRNRVVVMDESHDSFWASELGRFSESWIDEVRYTRFEQMVKQFPNIEYFCRPNDYWKDGRYTWLGDDQTVFSDRMKNILKNH